MKKLLLAGFATLSISAPAFAADLPMKAPPMAPPEAIYNWTGIYIGAHAGWGWAKEDSTELAPGTTAFPTGTVFNGHNLSGPLGGVQGGFNWQFSQFVLGVEGEWSGMDLTGTATTISTVNGFVSTSAARTKDLETVAGRFGYAVNNWLLYVKGGGAWSQGSSIGTGVLASGRPFDTTTSSSDRSGWVVGVGFEWGFAPGWSAKVEYDHVDLGSTNITILSSLGTTSFVNSTEKIDLVKAGVNYRFNWGGPVVAKY